MIKLKSKAEELKKKKKKEKLITKAAAIYKSKKHTRKLLSEEKNIDETEKPCLYCIRLYLDASGNWIDCFSCFKSVRISCADVDYKDAGETIMLKKIR